MDQQAFEASNFETNMIPPLNDVGLFFQEWAQMVFLSPPANILNVKCLK